MVIKNAEVKKVAQAIRKKRRMNGAYGSRQILTRIFWAAYHSDVLDQTRSRRRAMIAKPLK